eukprot:397731_1
MSPGVLESGIYQFNVTISIYSEDIIVKYGAHITSFIVNPDCDNEGYRELIETDVEEKCDTDCKDGTDYTIVIIREGEKFDCGERQIKMNGGRCVEGDAAK